MNGSPTPQRSHTKRIVVVGAGIIGAAIAHMLARAGHEVVVLERAAPAGAATGASFAWVGVAKSPAAASISPLRARAAHEFARLLTEIPEPIGRRPNGALSWEESDELTRAFVADHHTAALPLRLISGAEAQLLEPALSSVPEWVAHAPGDAGIDPVAFTQALLRSAARHGATVQRGRTVLRLLEGPHGVRGVMTDAGEISAARVILAAGTGSPALAATVSATIDLVPAPCCLVTFSTPEPLLRGIVSTPELEARQLTPTTLIAAEDVPEGFAVDPLELAAGTLAALRESLRDTTGVRLERATIANRPMPKDGEPRVGPAPEVAGLYTAVAHPGIILSAAIGRKVLDDHAWLLG